MAADLKASQGKLHTHPANSLLATITNKHTLQIENDIEKYIKAEAFLEQFRIKDFFEDFDKLRKGYVTEDKVASAHRQFRTGLALLKIHLTEDQIQALIAKYRIPNSDLVNYLSFCDSVEKQFYDVPDARSNLYDIKSKSVRSCLPRFTTTKKRHCSSRS